MFTVGASSTRADFVRASSPSTAPTSSISAGSQVAPRAEPHGTQAALILPAPSSADPRAPLGPSVTVTAGRPTRSTPGTVHMSAPHVSDAFSSSDSRDSTCSTSVTSRNLVAALQVEEQLLALHPAAVPGEAAVAAHHPVARDDDADRV